MDCFTSFAMTKPPNLVTVGRASRVTPEMALRLAKTIGHSPESWLSMQDNHDLWLAK